MVGGETMATTPEIGSAHLPAAGPPPGTKPWTDPAPVYSFVVDSHVSLKNNMLSGIGLSAWLELLVTHWRDIDWRQYWPRVLFLSFMALFNSLVGLLDTLFFAHRIAAQTLNPRPVFILGHPRTGTTHLHNLLALDEARFATCTVFHAGFPLAFLTTESILSRLLRPILDTKRPMDNMALSFDTPCEDEVATCGLSAGRSPYMPLVFPRLWRRYIPFYSLDSAGPDEERWLHSFLFLLRKLTVRHGTQRRLVLKSPVHTGRVRLLLKLFPNAQFVYIHRHPYDVFKSATHMADTYYNFCYLQRPTNAGMTEFVLHQYELLYELYERDRPDIPQGQLHELSFADLDGNPEAALRSLYTNLGWADFDQTLLPKLRRYRQSLHDFKKNDFLDLAPELKALVARRWAPSFRRFGYTP